MGLIFKKTDGIKGNRPEVSVDKQKQLSQEMFRLGIRQEDIEEKFIRSAGPGGQNVNKVSTCVYLKYLPTGIEVKCQKERSQARNRYIARVLLLKKIEDTIKKKAGEQKQYKQKLLRQKRGRSRKVKLRILEEKRRHSRKKELRASGRGIEW